MKAAQQKKQSVKFAKERTKEIYQENKKTVSITIRPLHNNYFDIMFSSREILVTI
jgi:hypothetical protein